VNNHNGLLLSTPAPGRSALLTGGTYGPDGSVLAMIVGILACIAIVWASKKGLFRRTRAAEESGLTPNEAHSF
jgi:hypothetical protein